MWAFLGSSPAMVSFGKPVRGLLLPCSDFCTVNKCACTPCAVRSVIPQTSALVNKLVCADDFPAGGTYLFHFLRNAGNITWNM